MALAFAISCIALLTAASGSTRHAIGFRVHQSLASDADALLATASGSTRHAIGFKDHQSLASDADQTLQEASISAAVAAQETESNTSGVLAAFSSWGISAINLHWVAVPASLLLLLTLALYMRAPADSVAFAQYLPIFTTMMACFVYMIVGPALITLNKHIFQQLHFSYPLTVSSLGLLASIIGSHGMVLLGLGSVRPETLAAASGPNWFRVALPIGACKATTLAFGNAVYLFLGLGFIQMLKCFTPAMILCTSLAFGLPLPSRPSLLCVGLIILGTMVEVKGELHASVVGLLIMGVADAAESVSMVWSQKLLQDNKLTIIEGLYALAPAGFLCLTLVAIPVEWPKIYQSGDWRIILAHPTVFATAALLGFSVNFIGFWVVQATSALMLKLLNIVRVIGLVICGCIFYGEVVSRVELVGFSVALFGFLGYNLFQVSGGDFSAMARFFSFKPDDTAKPTLRTFG